MQRETSTVAIPHATCTARSSSAFARKRRGTFAVVAAVGGLVGVVSACRTPSDNAGAASSTPSAVLPTTADGSASSDAPSPLASYAEAELSTRPVELLKLQLTSAVKERMPVDKLVLAHPGDRVYAHLTIRNRTGRPRKVHLTFVVNGKTRSEMDLEVAESWSYRTWGYQTLLKTDKPGKLTLSVADDEGNPLDDVEVPILSR